MPRLYLLATNTKKPVAHLITAVTGEAFNHSSIAFDPSLAECYSFNMGHDGFVKETKNVWPSWTDYELYSIEVSQKGLADAKRFVSEMSKSGHSFAFRGTLGVIAGMSVGAENTRFCSQFVEQACLAAGLPPSSRDPGLATPLAVCARFGSKLVSSGMLHPYLMANLSDRRFSLVEAATEIELGL